MSQMRKVRKRFDLLGNDGLELELRINVLRRALAARGGGIVDIKWSRGDVVLSARILYEVCVPTEANAGAGDDRGA